MPSFVSSFCGNLRKVRGFTLLEMLVATAILSLLLVVVFSAISQLSTIWRRSMDKIESFKDAREAFESITRRLSQATLNTYLDYDDPSTPKRYMRQSELKFLCGAAGDASMPGTANTGSVVFFQAPMGYTTNTTYSGMDSLLNTCGYFVSFTKNSGIPSHVGISGKNPYRYRLMQMLFPANVGVDVVYNATNWFNTDNLNSYARPVADNVIALIVRPQDPGAVSTDLPNRQYAYDSTLNAKDNPQPITANQLPPVVQVTIVAIDETSAKRLDNGSTPPSAISTALGSRFTDPTQYQYDMDALTASLNSSRINYRVFSTAVPIRESKWTK